MNRAARRGIPLAVLSTAIALLAAGFLTGEEWMWTTGIVLALVFLGLFIVLPLVVFYMGSGWAERQRAAQSARRRRKKRKAAGRKGSRKGRAGRCVVLDADAAVLYGLHAPDGTWEGLRPAVRDLLLDGSVEKVVTPAAMRKVRGLCRDGLLAGDAMERIEALAGGTACDGGGGGRIAAAVESEQRRVADSPDSDAALRWLAARRGRYRMDTGTDYGSPRRMEEGDRRRNLAGLCDMAADGRLVMEEAADISASRARTVLLSGDPDVLLFKDALKRAAAGDIRVAGIGTAPRSGDGASSSAAAAARADPEPDAGGGPR